MLAGKPRLYSLGLDRGAGIWCHHKRRVTWYVDLQRISRTFSNAVPEERRSIVEKSVAYKLERRAGTHLPLSSSISTLLLLNIPALSMRGQGRVGASDRSKCRIPGAHLGLIRPIP